VLPEELATVARLLPLTPVIELAQLGVDGRTWDGEVVAGAGLWWAALGPLGTLLAWTAIAALATARWFRWSPRR
jgi:ABC-2 type transport system permease protein